jgi:hypothetical protein
LAKVVAQYPQAYAQLDADPGFQKELAEVVRELRAMNAEKIQKECGGFIADARAETSGAAPGAGR